MQGREFLVICVLCSLCDCSLWFPVVHTVFFYVLNLVMLVKWSRHVWRTMKDKGPHFASLTQSDFLSVFFSLPHFVLLLGISLSLGRLTRALFLHRDEGMLLSLHEQLPEWWGFSSLGCQFPEGCRIIVSKKKIFLQIFTDFLIQMLYVFWWISTLLFSLLYNHCK